MLRMEAFFAEMKKADKEFEARRIMTLTVLLAAIKRAKKVMVYVPVGSFFIHVPVAKTKILKTLQDSTAYWDKEGMVWEDRFMAEWLEDEDGVLVVGEEWDDREEDEEDKAA